MPATGNPSLISYSLDATLTAQAVLVPQGCEILSVHAESGQVRMDLLGDRSLKSSEAVVVHLVRTGTKTGDLRKEWFRGVVTTSQGVTLSVFVEPKEAQPTSLSTFGPLNWVGVWIETRYYTLDDVVRSSTGNLYRCYLPENLDGTSPEPGVDAGWTNYWELLIAAGGGGGIPDAPIDGQQYVRQDALWVLNTAGGGGSLEQGSSFPDPYNEHFYATFGVDGAWEAIRFSPGVGDATTGADQIGTKPTTLAALQGLTYT